MWMLGQLSTPHFTLNSLVLYHQVDLVAGGACPWLRMVTLVTWLELNSSSYFLACNYKVGSHTGPFHTSSHVILQQPHEVYCWGRFKD